MVSEKCTTNKIIDAHSMDELILLEGLHCHAAILSHLAQAGKAVHILILVELE